MGKELRLRHMTSILVHDFLNLYFPPHVRRMSVVHVQASPGGQVEGGLANQGSEAPPRADEAINQRRCQIHPTGRTKKFL